MIRVKLEIEIDGTSFAGADLRREARARRRHRGGV
jgi:hypothetical protein